MKKYELIQNERGGILIVTMMVSLLIGIVMSSILGMSTARHKIANNANTPMEALRIKAKVINALNSKSSWDLTKNTSENKSSFNSGGSTSAKLNIIDFESKNIVVHSQNSAAGFNTTGEPCNTFNENEGSDECPFRYEVVYLGTVSNAGITKDKVAGYFKYRPRNQKVPFNASKYDFEMVLGADEKTESSIAEATCKMLGGEYNNFNCTKQFQKSACKGQLFLKGISLEGGDCSEEEAIKTATLVCPEGQYIKGIVNGSAYCQTYHE